MEIFDFLIKKILTKKEIKNFDKKIIDDYLNKYFLTNGNLFKKLERLSMEKIEKNNLFKKIIKDIKKDFTTFYASFLEKDFSKKHKLIDSKIDDNKKLTSLLKIHKSTNERLRHYDEIYSKIFLKYKNVKKVFDLGCGMNPISYYFLKEKNLKFECFDLNREDIDFLNKYFKKFKIKAKAKSVDLFFDYEKILSKIKKNDLVFMLKFLDVLEFRKKNISLEILKKLKTKNIVISFSTKSLCSKKQIKDEKRNWIRNFLKKNNFIYEEFEIENELFFLIN